MTFRLNDTEIGTDGSFECVDIINIGNVEIEVRGRSPFGGVEDEIDVAHVV